MSSGMSSPPLPERPAEPVYEDAEAQPDEPHDWCWPGHTDNDFCRKCEAMNCDCGSETCLDYARDDQSCARERARRRNWDREQKHKKAMERYEAQMDYWRSLVGVVGNQPTEDR